MSIKKVEIQDQEGNVYHPHTDAKVVFTSDGKSVEEELKSLKQSANNGKQTIAAAIGSPLQSTDTFGAMGTKIDTLTQTFQNTLTEKGVEVLPSDKMSTLIGKVDGIKNFSTFPNWLKKREQWLIAEPMEHDTAYAGVTILDNYLYVQGGYWSTTDMRQKTRRMNLSTGVWETLSEMTTYKYQQHQFVAVNGKLYAMGGADTFRIEEVDLNTGKGTLKNAQISSNIRYYGSSSVMNNKVHWFGGYSGSSSYDIHQVYDAASDTISTSVKVPYLDNKKVCVKVNENVAHILSGMSTSNYKKHVIWNDATQTWSMLSDSPEVLSYGVGAHKDGCLFITNANGSPKSFKYNISTQTWTQITNTLSIGATVRGAQTEDQLYLVSDTNNRKQVTCFVL